MIVHRLVHRLVDFIYRYIYIVLVVSAMGTILFLHALGLFPRAGIYDVSHLIGSSQITFEGVILDAPVLRWNQTRFLMQGHAWPQEAFKGKVLVTLAFPDEGVVPGDRLRIRGWLSEPRPPSRSRSFDERGYWASKGVFSLLKVWSPESMIIVKRTGTWRLSRRAWRFHQRFRRFWESVLEEEDAALLLGITMGARGVLPAALKEDCIRAGVYHIVVVSGQNMALIVGLGVSFLAMLRVPRRHALWLCAGPIVFYTATVGGDPPVVRAAVMALVGLTVSALGRDIPRFYPLMLAAGWILVQEPEALLGASFQLSFGATLSILAIFPFWDERRSGRSRVWRWVKEAGLMGLTVHLGIWPLLVFYFHRLSLAGFIANWTVFPLSGILMVQGLFVGTWGVLFPETIPVWVLRVVEGSTRFTLKLIHRMADVSWAVRPIQPPAGWIVALYYGALFGILFVLHRRPNPYKS